MLTARQEIAGLGANDLKFTAEEIQALVEQSYDEHISRQQAEELARELEGWIRGILLTTHTMWKGLLKGIVQAKGSGSPIYEYLANEVFKLQSKEVQKFLEFSSILREMSSALCDELLGIDDSRRIFKLLEDRNLFIIRLEKGEERWYRYHHLFREFLQAKMEEEEADEIVPLHARAARLFEEQGNWSEAIHHYLKAMAYPEAARVITATAKETFESGKLKTLSNWIDALPTEVLEDNPLLLWYKARIYTEIGKLDKANEFLDRAHAKFLERGDKPGIAQVMVKKGNILRLQGRYGEAIKSCQRALSVLSERESNLHIFAEVHKFIGICQVRTGDFPRGITELKRSLQLYKKVNDLFNIADVHNDLGAALKHTGDLSGAEVHYQEALQIWQQIGNPSPIANTLNNIGVGYCYQGRYEDALEVYQRALAQARQAASQRLEAFIQAGIGDVHRDLGRYEEAMEAYREALKLAKGVCEGFLIVYLMDAIGDIHRLEGNYAKALELIEQAYQRAKEQGSDYQMALCETSLGVVNYEQGKSQRALEYLIRARDAFARSGAKIELAKVYLHLAQAFYSRGRPQEALKNLEAMLDYTSKLGYDHFLVSPARRTLPLLKYAVEKGFSGERLTSLLERAERSREAVQPPAKGTPTMVKVRPPLYIYGLGEARVLRGNEVIADSDWGTTKAKEMFFYLLCHPPQRKDQIGSTFWPDLSPAKLRSAFHVTLYRLRRALSEQESAIYEDGKYFFNRQLDYWFDVEEFEKLIAKADRARSEEEAMKCYEESIALYQGEFLEDLYSSSRDEWIILRREELLMKYLEALRKLGELHVTRGEYGEGIETYKKILAKDNYQEEAHRGLMRCYALLGRRNMALKHYHLFNEFMEEEFGAEPLPETTELYRQILEGKFVCS